MSRIGSAQEARQLRQDMATLTDRLIKESDEPAGRVIAAVAACRHELSRLGVPQDHLLTATAACARARLLRQAAERRR